MATEIRLVTEDDLDRAHFILAYSFTGDRSPEGREGMKHLESMGPLFALYEDGEMAACLRVFPLRMFIHGASIPLGGVAGVACLPEHRRKSYVAQLLRHALVHMREQGQPLSALHTPHASLYRRYGWMIASSALQYSFNPKELSPVSETRIRGRAYRISEEEWSTVAEIYRLFVAQRNGYLDRDERWWKEALFRRLYDEKRRPNDVAVWRTADARPSGYVAYHTTSDHRADAPSADKLAVQELVALDADAYAGLLRYLLSHDLAEEISWWGAPGEPFALTIDQPGRVRRVHHDGFMLRVVDVEQAVAARPPAAGTPEGAVTIRISDAAAPWNEDLWRIECSGPAGRGGRLSAARAKGTAELSTDAATFAAMYNGFLRPSEAARSGLAEAGDPSVLGLADQILAADYPPHSSEFF